MGLGTATTLKTAERQCRFDARADDAAAAGTSAAGSKSMKEREKIFYVSCK